MAKTTVKTLVALLALYALLIPTGTILANEIKVDDHCTLIEAIGSANNDSSKARCERGWREDTIILKENIVLEEELPYIRSNITIEGNGYAIFVRQRNPAFTIKWGSLTIRNLRVRFRGENRSGPTVEIRNGSISIIDSKIHNCSGKFVIEDSTGVVIGDDYICGYKPETVNSWFDGVPEAAEAGTEPATDPQPQPQVEPSGAFVCESASGPAATLKATYGATSGAQCRHVDALGIGNQSVLDAGVVDAVDIWGYVEQGVEVCFPQAGAIILLDATTAPRSVVTIEAYAINGTTCAALNRPGTVVLTPGTSPPAAAPVAAPVETVAVAEETVAAAEPQSGQCQVTLTGHLRHRAAPAMGDNIIGYVARGTTLPRLSSTTYWIHVEYRGQVGWIIDSPRYIVYSGACD